MSIDPGSKIPVLWLIGKIHRYLWVTLQLDAIFPSNATTIITDEQVIGLLDNLPKSLPDALDRALEGITDSRYQNTIMKLVMAAPSPLTLDELRVALTITPGEPKWHAARVPTDGSQLIALCGGSLLELDEEDNKVRFIHHSVMLHLLSPATNTRTSTYHFSLSDADILSGSLCVTYLNMSIFDTRVTTTKKITANHLANKVINTANHDQPIITRFAQHFKCKSRARSLHAVQFDIGRIASEIQAARLKDSFNPRCFQDYAVRNWLLHSKAFRENDSTCSGSWALWTRLVHGYVDVAKVPFESPLDNSFPALSWALANNHEALFFGILSDPKTEPSNVEDLSRGITNSLKSTPQGYNTKWLGHIFTHLIKLAIDHPASTYSNGLGYNIGDHRIQSLPNMVDDYSLGVRSSLQHLLQLGADPMVPHFRTSREPLQMLISAMAHESIDQHSVEAEFLYTILDNVVSREETSSSLQSSWVPKMLRDLVNGDKETALRRILIHQPNLNIDPPEDSLVGTAVARRNVMIATELLRAGASAGDGSYIENRPAIQLALETRQKDMLRLLARHGGILHVPELRAGHERDTSLLQMAIEQMDAEWVCLLLGLGTDPNGGPHRSEISTTQRQEEWKRTQLLFPLQAAMLRNDTSMSLALLEHGASISPPTGPRPMDVAMEKRNIILVGKIMEIQKTGFIKVKPGIPTLLSACRTLSHVVSERSAEVQSLMKAPQAEPELRDTLFHLQTTTMDRDFYYRDHPAGNTILHYLTGGMESFNGTALGIAESVLARLPDLISVRNEMGETLLDRAVFRGSKNSWRPPYLESLQFLLDKAGDSRYKKTRDEYASALSIAISSSSPVDPVIRRLLEAGLNPNAGRSPFMALELAIKAEDEEYAFEVVTLLLRRGANPFSEVVGEGSLLDCARRMGRTRLEILLQESMLRIQQGTFDAPTDGTAE